MEEPNKLAKIRKLMQEQGISGYLIPHNDAHNSEYTMSKDERIKFISGFSGSAGTCLITHDIAYLWTDGRYFLQAPKELEEGWELMKIMKGVPYYPTWITTNLPNSKIGLNPELYPIGSFEGLGESLKVGNIELVGIEEDLVDKIWMLEPPPPSQVIVHEEEYSGGSVEERIGKIRETVMSNKGEGIVICSLDNIAWALNMRGSDIEFNPLFMAYLIITWVNESPTILLYSDPLKFTTQDVKQHLANNNILLYPYTQIFLDISGVKSTLIIDKAEINYKLHNLLSTKVIYVSKPVSRIKMIKNERELNGYRNCHITDGLNLTRYLAWLEEELVVNKRTDLNEFTAAMKMKEFRALGRGYMGLSFETISSTGPNAAMIHYSATASDNRQLNSSEIYLLDSGCQYLEGTTDVTRTNHMGDPTPREIEMYTRVLMGNLDVEMAVYPKTEIYSIGLDFLARRWLYQAGVDYRHGTGHGVGHFLNVHEGPIGISGGTQVQVPMANTITSIEPGYYEEKAFGIRIENLVLCLEHPKFPNMVHFENITISPYCRKLIDVELLQDEHISCVNQYHQKVQKLLLPLLSDEGNDQITKEYIRKNTQPIAKINK